MGASEGASAVARALLAWYDRGHRALPWRAAPSPYRTLVSEVMLQQTVVATVVPYFRRFVAALPDFTALAGAPEEEVLALWSGLGYYSRARNLQRAARHVVEHHGGVLPADEQALRQLPGVGEYTAAALAAIAFGIPTFPLDGNGARVMARLGGVPDSIDRPAVRKRLRALGQSLVPRDRAGDFAQAVMELGATVCVPRGPRCDLCPLRRRCRAFAQERVKEIPARAPKRPKRVVELACVAVERAGRVLLVQRAAGELLGGTWTLPAAEATASDARRGAPRRALRALGLTPSGRPQLGGVVRHIFTHRDVTARVFRMDARGTVTGETIARWFGREELERLALSSFTRKTLSVVGR